MSTSSERAREAACWNEAGAYFASDASWLGRVLRRRFGSSISHEDIVQEAYLRVADAVDVRHPRALLLQIASRLAIDQLRRQRHASAYAHAQEVQDHVCAPEQDESLLLKQLLSGLPSVCRETFLLSRFEGLSYEEIALRQGVSVKTVEWRISKALAYCTARLDV